MYSKIHGKEAFKKVHFIYKSQINLSETIIMRRGFDVGHDDRGPVARGIAIAPVPLLRASTSKYHFSISTFCHVENSRRKHKDHH